jgi:hypothetical protein
MSFLRRRLSYGSIFGKNYIALPGNPYSISGSANPGLVASATLRFRSAGTVASIRTTGGTTTTVEYGTWLLSGAFSDFRLVLTSGNVGLLNVYAGAASALNTPYNFSVDISMSAGAGGSDISKSETYGFDIRNIRGQTIISGSVSLNAEYTAGGGGGGGPAP